MAVSPLPRQSTMPLLQVHMAGQEPEDKLQSWARAASVCPGGEAKGTAKGWDSRVAPPQGRDLGGTELWVLKVPTPYKGHAAPSARIYTPLSQRQGAGVPVVSPHQGWSPWHAAEPRQRRWAESTGQTL